ncbi:MAG: S-layer homology domain-containing protein [Pseudoflavonifractor sp.]|nr:S-layer homology domain-containing protein [Pseudoflavonifractor sp.]
MKLKRFGALAASLALILSLTAVPAAAIEFTDVPSTYWGYADISKMSNQGYAKGYEDGTFKPDGKMTAAETLLFCARATGVGTSTQAKIAEARADEMKKLLPENMVSWAAKEMAVAVETGVLSLSELDALSQAGALAKTITRENLCMYLVRAMQLEPLAKSLSTYSLSYKDKNDISASLQPYVYVLTNFGIVKGTETGNFDPKGAVTRAQMTAMLNRALTFMASAGIQTELSEYTSYSWQAGTISAVTAAGDGATVLTLTSDFQGTRSYSIPSAAKIYENNMLTTFSALKTGQYVRLNLTTGGAVSEARLCGVLTTYSGSVSSLADGQLSVLTGGAVKNFTIDRFTDVMVGKTAGDRTLIDEDAGYATAVCYVDEMNHLAGVKFAGGTQLVTGLVKNVTTSSGTTTLRVSLFNGVVYTYTLPTGIAVTVNGVLGSLTAGNVGDYVQVRVSNDSMAAASVAVDTVTQYVQGPIKRLGAVGTARSVYIADAFTGKEVSYTVSSSAAITYNGEARTTAQIESGWYATALISNNMITQLTAYSGSVAVEGTLSSISYGTTTVLSVTKSDGNVATYNLDITALPDIARDNKTSSIDQLRTGDSVVVTLRYNDVEKIAATSQSANLTGTITKVTMESAGVTLEVKLSDGSTKTYPVSEGVSVTQNGSSSNIYSLKPGYSVALVTEGDSVISIAITGAISSSTSLTGTVLLTNSSGTTRTMTVQVTDSLGKVSLVTVNVKSASLLNLSGSSLNLSTGFAAGDTVTAYGSYDGATFVATIVIKQ